MPIPGDPRPRLAAASARARMRRAAGWMGITFVILGAVRWSMVLRVDDADGVPWVTGPGAGWAAPVAATGCVVFGALGISLARTEVTARRYLLFGGLGYLLLRAALALAAGEIGAVRAPVTAIAGWADLVMAAGMVAVAVWLSRARHGPATPRR